ASQTPRRSPRGLLRRVGSSRAGCASRRWTRASRRRANQTTECTAQRSRRRRPDERNPHVIWVQLTVVGVAVGAIYALAGMGLVLTYKATGIFNFAYGGIAMLVAYVYWQMRSQWDCPL